MGIGGVEQRGALQQAAQRPWIRRHRRSATAGAAVLAMVLGGTGLFWGLSSNAGSPVLSSARRLVPGDVDVAGAAVAPASSAASASGGQGGSAAFACPMIPAESGGTNGTSGTDAGPITSATSGSGVIGGVGSATHLFTRTTADGVVVRVYQVQSVSECGFAAGSGSGPDSSSGSSSDPQGSVVCGESTPTFSIELSDAGAVGQGTLLRASSIWNQTLSGSTSGSSSNAAAAAAPTDSEPLAMTPGAFGVAEGSPVWWVGVSVGSEVANVQMTFADGSSDQMTPVDGVAVLAHGIDASEASADGGGYDITGTLKMFDPSGAVVQTVDLPESAPTPTPVPVPLPTPVLGQTLPSSTSAPSVGGSVASPTATAATPPAPSVVVPSDPTPIVDPPTDPAPSIACPQLNSPAAAAG